MPVARGDRADRDAAHLLVRLVEPGRRQLPRREFELLEVVSVVLPVDEEEALSVRRESLDLVQAAENDQRAADANEGHFPSDPRNREAAPIGRHARRAPVPPGQRPATHEVTRAYVVTDDGRSRRLGGSSGNERAPVCREDSGRKREAALAGLDGERLQPALPTIGTHEDHVRAGRGRGRGTACRRRATVGERSRRDRYEDEREEWKKASHVIYTPRTQLRVRRTSHDPPRVWTSCPMTLV